MSLTWLDPLLLRTVDALFASLPRTRPDNLALQATQIVGHRGEGKQHGVLENSYAGFDPLPGRVFGLECDVRFSRDLKPVVFHDANLQRLFDCPQRLCDLSWHEIQHRFPQIPSLADLVARYGGRIHLMIEFKAEQRPQPAAQLAALLTDLSPLIPQRDFHVMSLDPATLDWLRPAFGNCRIAVARGNVRAMSNYALRTSCAAFTGHYALLGAATIQRHRQAGQTVGVGFPRSRHALRYAIHRGARWIYSDCALAMQSLLDSERNASSV